MKNVLVTGADRVVGANLAAVLADHYQVVAVSPTGTHIADCECLALDLTDQLAVREFVENTQPDIIVHCSTTSESSWGDEPDVTNEALCVANLAEVVDAKLVLVSGDQVYRGPWLFHAEHSDCLAATDVANSIHECEELVLATDGLVLRTHVLGWAPMGNGLLESMLSDLERGVPFRSAHFATPIAASRLAEVVCECLTSNLSGVFNIAGAERCSPFRFASSLAVHFHLPHPISLDEDAQYETSMRCDLIRGSLGIVLPTLSESIEAFSLQQETQLAAFGGASLARAA